METIAEDRGRNKRHSFSIMGVKKAVNMERGMSHVLISKEAAEFIELNGPELPSLVKDLR